LTQPLALKTRTNHDEHLHMQLVAPFTAEALLDEISDRQKKALKLVEWKLEKELDKRDVRVLQLRSTKTSATSNVHLILVRPTQHFILAYVTQIILTALPIDAGLAESPSID
jgi:hypothetical protein